MGEENKQNKQNKTNKTNKANKGEEGQKCTRIFQTPLGAVGILQGGECRCLIDSLIQHF